MKETKINISAFQASDASIFHGRAGAASDEHVRRAGMRSATGFSLCVLPSRGAVIPPLPDAEPGLQPVPLAAAILLCFRGESHGMNGTGVLENANSRGEATLQEASLRRVVLAGFHLVRL